MYSTVPKCINLLPKYNANYYKIVSSMWNPRRGTFFINFVSTFSAFLSGIIGLTSSNELEQLARH